MAAVGAKAREGGGLGQRADGGGGGQHVPAGNAHQPPRQASPAVPLLPSAP